MKYLALIITLFVCSAAHAQRVERVAPIYGEDDQANKMISYISEKLNIIIPPGQDVENLNGTIRCRLTIDPTGKICDIMIQKSLVLWLDMAVIDGLKAIPPSSSWRSPTTHELKRALVFSFGNGGRYQQKTYGFDGDKTTNQVEQSIAKYKQNLKDSLNRHWAKWEDKTKLDMKMPMPLSPDRNKNPLPELKTTTQTPSINLPKIGISLE